MPDRVPGSLDLHTAASGTRLTNQLRRAEHIPSTFGPVAGRMGHVLVVNRPEVVIEDDDQRGRSESVNCWKIV